MMKTRIMPDGTVLPPLVLSPDVAAGMNEYADSLLDDIDHIQDSTVVLDKNIDLLPSLSFLIGDSVIAGNVLHPAAMRDDDNRLLWLWTEEEYSEFLSSVTERKRSLESAKTLISQTILDNQNQFEIEFYGRTSTQKDWSEHNKAVFALANHAPNRVRQSSDPKKRVPSDEERSIVKRLFEDAFSKIEEQKATLPSELERAKLVLLARLESVANSHNKRIKNAATQQGIDLPESCIEQENATKQISIIKQLAQLEIESATDNEIAQNHYDSAVSKMAEVEVLNVPIAYDELDDVVTDFEIEENNSVNLTFRHPKEEIDGIVSVKIKIVDYAVGAFFEVESVNDKDGKFKESKVVLSAPDHYEQPAIYEVVARNLCGPAKPIKVTIVKKDQSIEPTPV